MAVAPIIEDLATQSNVNISKVAGEGVIKLLTPADRVAVNDASGTDAPAGGWAVPMLDVATKVAIDRVIDTMTPVDPLSYKPALTAAYNVRQHTNARIKHIILLADGDAEDSYYPLVTQIHKADITISTLATGGGTYGFGADYGTMQNIARRGAGRTCQTEAMLCCRVGAPSIDNQRVRDVNTSGTMSTVAGTLYATWPMRGAARACYASWRERGPLAVDAMNCSHREGATPQRVRV